MNINSNNYIKETERQIKSYSFLSEFSIKKREELTVLAKSILDDLKVNAYSDQDISKLLSIYNVAIQKSKGHWYSNIFINLFKHDKVSILQEKIENLDSIVKKLKKIQKMQLPTNQSPAVYDILFDAYVFERMNFYGHATKLNNDGEPTFRFVERKKVNHFSNEELSNLVTLKEKLVSEKAKLEIRRDNGINRYESVEIEKISDEAFQNYFNNEFNILEIVYPQTFLTIAQLCEKNSLFTKADQSYTTSFRYQYLDCGFTRSPQTKWEHLRPYTHDMSPPKDFKMELVVYSKETELPSVINNYGHAAVKFRTPGGEVYSVDFYPAEQAGDFAMHRGELNSPDMDLFKPSTREKQTKISYTIPNEKAFYKLLNYIEKMQSYNADQFGTISTCAIPYHLTNNNCSGFVSSVRDYALKLGARRDSGFKKISLFKRIQTAIEKVLLCIYMNVYDEEENLDKGFQVGDIKNYNLELLKVQKPYLPIDLLIESTSS
jgi:hypothetical protein